MIVRNVVMNGAGNPFTPPLIFLLRSSLSAAPLPPPVLSIAGRLSPAVDLSVGGRFSPAVDLFVGDRSVPPPLLFLHRSSFSAAPPSPAVLSLTPSVSPRLSFSLRRTSLV
ncbi:unnamed protein product [Microthlaspi erraticum]|uniref:Uncharacterized protein n=1 Tax=Microthlaspi erraticum TaxID=1685480 RepID=A0A6D2J4S6_9BRAS|nr:unnamed protein product [Microthlaspi erraticum]